jgi:hypothetical protein
MAWITIPVQARSWMSAGRTTTPTKEGLNKGLKLGLAISSLATKRVYWAALMPCWAAARYAGLVADISRPVAAQ